LGNTRGNKHSRKHLWLDPDTDPRYWDFTWQDMTTYDLPAGFHYIHWLTREKVNFIGHSQGATIMIAALAEHIEDITQLMGKVIALGPVIYMNNPETKLFKLIASYELASLLQLLEVYEFFEANSITNPTTAYICSLVPGVCGDLISVMSDSNVEIINHERLQVWTGHYPSGTSVKNLMHYQQMLSEVENIMRKYDYGEEINMKMYGQKTPVEYDLSSIEETFYLYAGLQDRMASILDTRNAIKKFPKDKVTVREIEAGHLSFLLGKDITYMMEIIDILNDRPLL